eukprot:g18732.t1
MTLVLMCKIMLMPLTEYSSLHGISKAAMDRDEKNASKGLGYKHPAWHGPFGESQLHVFNSLTETKTPFVPKQPGHVGWYICGPTVYDSAHLGHARAYVTFDILRRIMMDYFGYNVTYVMNVTDVDDKIILRARRNFLLAQYMQAGKTPKEVFEDASKAFRAALQNKFATLQELKKEVQACKEKDREYFTTKLSAENMQHDTLTKEFEALKAAFEGKQSAAEALVELSRYVLCEALDKKEGASVNEPHIFRQHAAKFEKEFLEDMTMLGVRPADCLTRVSEYITHIIAFVERIIRNGMAYETNGSVYFDVTAFRKTHSYGKLAPWCIGNQRLMEEGEGSSTGPASDKRSPSDFALWKSSKPGEPFWASPWGNGRPGWHIECSAMATDILGTNMDIHAGGDDLKFPHHDNELAQSEAFSGEHQWVNHFWHVGRLSIEGLKMSKSLKNFITIRKVLEHQSARNLRILFLQQRWDDRINFSEQSLTEAASKAKRFKEFFLEISSLMRVAGGVFSNASQLWNDQDKELHALLIISQQKVHAALCDNFDYPIALNLMVDLVTAANVYLRKEGAKLPLLRRIAEWLYRMLKTFGVVDTADSFAFSDDASGAGGGASQQVVPVVDAFAAFRDVVRAEAQKSKQGAILQACDHVRDTVLPTLGVRLEDVPNALAKWKLEDPFELQRELKAKEEKADEERRKKVSTKLAARQKELEKWTQAQMSPAACMMQEAGPESKNPKFSKFGQDGVPTHNMDGTPCSAKQVKAAQKLLAKLTKSKAELDKALAKRPNLLEELQLEVASLTQELAR